MKTYSEAIRYQLVVAPLIVLIACQAAAGQNVVKQSAIPASRSSEAEMVAASLWRTISTTCPVPGTTATSTFLRSDLAIVEFRDARTNLFPWHLTKADELNGTQFKGLAVLRASAHRFKGASGDKWETPRETRNNIFDGEELYREHSGYRYKWPEMWVVVMEKKNGRWSFRFSQFETPETLGQNSLATAATKKSCAELTTGSADQR